MDNTKRMTARAQYYLTFVNSYARVLTIAVIAWIAVVAVERKRYDLQKDGEGEWDEGRGECRMRGKGEGPIEG